VFCFVLSVEWELIGLFFCIVHIDTLHAAHTYYIQTYIHTRLYTYILYIHTHICTYIHTYTHTSWQTIYLGTSEYFPTAAHPKPLLTNQPQPQPLMLFDTVGGEVAQPCPLAFNMNEIEGFRYRVEDVRRAVTRAAVQDARVKEIKHEMLNSQRLKSHFEDNPKDLSLLKHDVALRCVLNTS
jgi:hypothetical protein